jgi:hypothetical protein
MAFYNKSSNPDDFAIHQSSEPSKDFGIFAKGYANAAVLLTEHLLKGPRFSSYEAYPIVFLFRHALELYLKGVVVKGLHLDSLASSKNLQEKRHYVHRLAPLNTVVSRILKHCFPGDAGIDAFLDKLAAIVRDFETLDPDSFTFRYPVDKTGAAPSSSPLYVNLRDFAVGMSELMEDFETLEFGLDIETYKAHDVHEILMSYE